MQQAQSRTRMVLWQAFFLMNSGILASGCASVFEPPAPEPVAVFPADTKTVRVRTPAKMVGSAYHIKIKLVRGDFDWILPVWVKPDVKESYLDPAIMRLMGWPSHEPFLADEVFIAGVPVRIQKFQSGKSDWFYSPEFSKNCCAGVIGQDVLRYFRVQFSPKEPVHLLWTQLPDAPMPGEEGAFHQPLSELSGVFNLKETRYLQYDLSKVGFTLDPRAKKLEFNP